MYIKHDISSLLHSTNFYFAHLCIRSTRTDENPVFTEFNMFGQMAKSYGSNMFWMCASTLPQVGNAIKSSLHGAALKSNNKEGARSIQVEITPTSSRISRNAVTSLSIRGHRWKRHGKTHAGGRKQI